MKHIIRFSLVLIILLFSSITYGWTTQNGVVVCTTGGNQDDTQIVADGEGGAIIVWLDQRDNLNYKLFAQKISSTGNSLWTLNGIAVDTIHTLPTYPIPNPQLISDGNGGAFITWIDVNNVRVQRISSSGTKLWIQEGISVFF